MLQKIILADRQVIFRTGATRVLASAEGLRIVAQCGDLQSLYAAIDDNPKSVVLFSSGLTENLCDLLERIARAGSWSVVIVEHGSTLEDEPARRAGGIVSRSVTGPQLVDCIRRVIAGQHCVRPAEVQVEPRDDSEGARVLQQLTPKELQIVALVSEGSKNKNIAEQLGTKEQVIKNYLLTIYEKTGVADRLELALFTQHHRILAEAADKVRRELQRNA